MRPQHKTAINAKNKLSLQLWEDDVTTSRLTEQHESEILEFLAERPIHTVAMAGFIRDNGVVSKHNRGTFFACRDHQGRLEGVALIGHATLIETRTDRALQAFAQLAKSSTTTNLIMGERERITEFFKYYGEGGQQARRACRELLFELRRALQFPDPIIGLRLGTPRDLELVVPVHAQLSLAESGIDPLEVDAEGFRRRCLRRLERNRTYVWIEDGKLLFKADVIAETAGATYLEGVWVNPEISGRGFGLRCLSQLAQSLLSRSQSVCLLTNTENQIAQRFYKKAGFRVRGTYDSIFLSSSHASPSTSTH